MSIIDKFANNLFQVPRAVVLNVARQTSTFMEDFQNEDEYIKRRLSDLQVIKVLEKTAVLF